MYKIFKFNLTWGWNLGFLWDGDSMNINVKYTNFASYKGFGWNTFQKAWQHKVDEVTKLVSKGRNLDGYLALDDISKYKTSFEKNFYVLGLQSKEILFKVAHKYDEQYRLLIHDYVGTSDFVKVFSFLEDLPLYLIEAMEELKEQENEEKAINLPKGIPPKLTSKVKYKQEEEYHLPNKLGETQLIFFGGGF